MTPQQKAAVLLGIDGEAYSAILDMLTEIVADEIKAYCNIDSVPVA